jgi:hypothetical protein
MNAPSCKDYLDKFLTQKSSGSEMMRLEHVKGLTVHNSSGLSDRESANVENGKE